MQKLVFCRALPALGQQLGEMHHPGPQPAAPNSMLELTVATGVDHGDHVETGVGDFIEMAVKHARAVVRTEDRVGPGSSTARRGARQLDVLADAGQQLSPLASDTQAVAQVAESCSPIRGRSFPWTPLGGLAPSLLASHCDILAPAHAIPPAALRTGHQRGTPVRRRGIRGRMTTPRPTSDHLREERRFRAPASG